MSVWGITHEKVILNDAGRMVQTEWTNLATRFEPAVLDEFIAIPNHFHGIVLINENETTDSVGAPLVGAQHEIDKIHRADTRSAPTLGDNIGAFLKWADDEDNPKNWQ